MNLSSSVSIFCNSAVNTRTVADLAAVLLIVLLFSVLAFICTGKAQPIQRGKKEEESAQESETNGQSEEEAKSHSLQPHEPGDSAEKIMPPRPAVPTILRHDLPCNLTVTDEFRDVADAIDSGAPFVLVTGGAGTGKTTLIRWLLSGNCSATTNAVVLAFTGTAALVCHGSTFHSFFRLPFGLLLDDTWRRNEEENFVNVCRRISLLIIDEISMVRSDLMDAADRRLREARNNSLPFGGVPVLMVGDPCQLPPIVTAEESDFFSTTSGGTGRDIWQSPWFFHARVFRKSGHRFEHIKLTHVFRQEEGMREYVEHLNRLRAQSLQSGDISASLDYFNRHCHTDLPLFDKSAVTITFTRAEAQKINDEKLQTLSSPLRCYDAIASGVFVQANNRITPPNDATLKLKVGAQIVMLVNDVEKIYVNGSLGTVLRLGTNSIDVQLHNGPAVTVERYCWVSYAYIYNEQTHRIEQKENGRFTQFPLKAAWAFTAHKSQGKTLDRVNLILDRSAFSPGQTYVALSRTRKISDMRFSAPLDFHHFRSDLTLRELPDYFE